MRRILICTFVLYCALFITHYSLVHAEYVLPYPSFMPGNKLYGVSRIIDSFSVYWYFGSIAQIKYRLKLSDKYLIESKTLFEYRQYVLALDALKRSDNEFGRVPHYVSQARKERKDMANFFQTIISASQEHKRILGKSMELVPISFLWTPENSAPAELALQEAILRSIEIRNDVATQLSKQ